MIFVPVGALHDVVQAVPSQQLRPFVADVVVGVVEPPTTSRIAWLWASGNAYAPPWV